MCARFGRCVVVIGLVGMLMLALLPVFQVSAQGKIKVVATFSILGDLVAQVGGDKIALVVLVPAGSDPHTFEPAPADSVALTEADLILEMGLGFEAWLEGLVESSGTGAKVVAVTDGIDLLPALEGHARDSGGEKPAVPKATVEHQDEYGEFDPHVWHDVKNAMIIVTQIRDALAAVDTINASSYQINADLYLKQLEALDVFMVETLSAIPENRRVLFTNHDVFGYLGARYELRVDGALGITTEAADPSAAQLGAIIEAIRVSGVPAIFVEAQLNPQIIELISREAGVSIAPDLYTDSLSDQMGPASDYLQMMRYNASTIAEALKQ